MNAAHPFATHVSAQLPNWLVRELPTYNTLLPTAADGHFFNIGGSRIYLDGSFQYAWGLLSAPCVEGSGCDPRALRLGANVSYHLPW
jgi:hypothetical protein